MNPNPSIVRKNAARSAAPGPKEMKTVLTLASVQKKIEMRTHVPANGTPTVDFAVTSEFNAAGEPTNGIPAIFYNQNDAYDYYNAVR